MKRLLLTLTLAFLGLAVQTASAKPDFSNDCYTVRYTARDSDDVPCWLQIGDKVLHLGHRIETWGLPEYRAWMRGACTRFEEKKEKDATTLIYERPFVCRTKEGPGASHYGETNGTARIEFVFRPTEIKYTVTLTPNAPGTVKLGRGHQWFSSLIWPHNPLAFQGWTLRTKFRDGTYGMNEFELKDGFNEKTCGLSGGWNPTLRWDAADDRTVITCLADTGSYVSLNRYGRRGEHLESGVKFFKPAGLPYSAIWDRAYSFGCTIKILKMNGP